MPEQVWLYRVFISSPSDVEWERGIVVSEIALWNLHHGDAHHVRLEALHWSSHSHPEVGRRGQAIINRQVLDKSDLVVALFRGRIGSPTGRYPSGTAEEIERARKARKKVLIYFADSPGATRDAALESYRSNLMRKALVGHYKNREHLREQFRTHLAHAMNELLAGHRDSS